MTTMLILSRGCTARTKNILKDLERLTPSIRENKYDQKNKLADLRELMDINECTSTLYFESTKRNNYLWISHSNGPSIRFIAYNLYTMQDLSFSTNCYKRCGHKLLFDTHFDDESFDGGKLKIVKKLFENVFEEKEDFDRVITFFFFDGKIWMRIYVIREEGLDEIGPRMVIEVDKIIEGCFKGQMLYKQDIDSDGKENCGYINNNLIRDEDKEKSALKQDEVCKNTKDLENDEELNQNENQARKEDLDEKGKNIKIKEEDRDIHAPRANNKQRRKNMNSRKK